MIEFISKEGTKYIWEGNDNIVDLTPQELTFSQIKVRLMSDWTILNQTSGNSIQMGIPLQISASRLSEVKRNYRRILSDNPDIRIESHALDRLIEDSLIPDDDPRKRGWLNEDDIRECVRSINEIQSIRLNVNHQDQRNTDNRKYLHPEK